MSCTELHPIKNKLIMRAGELKQEVIDDPKQCPLCGKTIYVTIIKAVSNLLLESPFMYYVEVKESLEV